MKYTDPTGMYTSEEQIEFMLSPSDKQMEFLKSEYNSVKNASNEIRGSKAAEMRELKSLMNLTDLFKIDEEFMNADLRDFLNLKEDGTMNYTKADLTAANGWTEMPSVGAQMHQTFAGDVLNAKFVNKDGREVVLQGDILVTNIADKGTFNYVNGNIFTSWGFGGHKRFDMNPYTKQMSNLGINTVGNWHKGIPGLFLGNSKF